MQFNKNYIILALALSAFSVNAQKYGYINTQDLIIALPEVQAANKQLDSLKTDLQNQGKAMVMDLQKKAAALEAKRPELAPVEFEKQATALRAEQEKLKEFDEKSQQRLYDKSAELLNPIEEKVNLAIKAVAQEEGYKYIFDMSQGFLLYVDPSTNVFAKVKAKLGL